MKRSDSLTLITLLASSCMFTNLRAQVANPTVAPEQAQTGPQPVYRVTVIARTAKAVNYRHRSGWTKVDLQGTPLAPEATGHADVNSRQGYLEVKAEMHHLKPASRFGPEYLTYVMWAITPEGRAKNLGEVLPNDGDNSKLDVTTELQAFGLIVTAEPVFRGDAAERCGGDGEHHPH
jgi:hypothetical protein